MLKDLVYKVVGGPGSLGGRWGRASEPFKKSIINGTNWETNIDVDILSRGKFRAHMQKFGLKSQKLSEILIFQNFVKLRFCLTLIYESCQNFEAT